MGFDTSETDHTEHHASPEALDAAFDYVIAAPTEVGTVEMVLCRPEDRARVVLEVAELDVEVGVVGDTWSSRPSKRTEDGSAHPDMQLNLMNSRVTAAVAGARDRWELCGDQIYVDFSLSPDALPAWTKLRIGDAVIETTDQPHTGCAKFRQRFGAAALKWINSDAGRANNFRGICAKVIEPGTVRPGDTITRL